MELKPGLRLHSAVCTTQVIVVRAPKGVVDLRCGGRPMVIAVDGGSTDPASLDPARRGETVIGKRYAHDGLGMELLVTRSGEGLLAVGDELLELKGAKPLPASD